MRCTMRKKRFFLNWCLLPISLLIVLCAEMLWYIRKVLEKLYDWVYY